jgi:two-component system, NarL family, nitrate/nitrite response regulator NarL
MDECLCVAVVDDHERLVGTLRSATRSSRFRVVGPYAAHDRAVRGGADVVVVDLDRDDGHGLATLVRVCEEVRAARIIAATAERDPELGSAVITAGANGLLGSRANPADIEAGLRRAAAGELVLPDEHLPSLVERLRIGPAERLDAVSIGSLTPRELQVLRALSYGESTAEIAASLGITAMTVQSHVKSVLTKLRVHSKVEAVRFAWRSGAIAMPATT